MARTAISGQPCPSLRQSSRTRPNIVSSRPGSRSGVHDLVARKHPVSEHWKVKDDSLAPRVLAEGGSIGFLEHPGGVLLLRLAVLELRQRLHHVPDERAVLPRGCLQKRFASAARGTRR